MHVFSYYILESLQIFLKKSVNESLDRALYPSPVSLWCEHDEARQSTKEKHEVNNKTTTVVVPVRSDFPNYFGTAVYVLFCRSSQQNNCPVFYTYKKNTVTLVIYHFKGLKISLSLVCLIM